MMSHGDTAQWHCHHHPFTFHLLQKVVMKLTIAQPQIVKHIAQRSLTNPVVYSCLAFLIWNRWTRLFLGGTGVTTALWNLNPLPLLCGQWKNIFPITIFSGCVAKYNHIFNSLTSCNSSSSKVRWHAKSRGPKKYFSKPQIYTALLSFPLWTTD